MIASLVLAGASAFGQQANFTSDVTQGCFPLTVKFNDTSTGTVTSWLWDFGNNNTSTLQNPSAVFASPGTYNVSLTVSNGGSPSTRIRSAYIVVHEYPETNFSLDVTSGCAPLTVKFRDETIGDGQISNWLWIFGDGATSTLANPVHTYTEPGSRIVTLRAKNQHGCENVKISEAPVTVLGPIPKFSADKLAVCSLPAEFQFTNQSTGTGLTYRWDFGNGQTATTQNASHTYTTAGNYDVTLRAKDGNGCEQSFKLTVSAGNEGGLDFTASSLKVCAFQPVDFELVSNDAPVSFNWTFGDGASSNQRDPTHTYQNPGTYTVVLEALLLNHTCASLVKKTVLVAPAATPSFTHTIDCNYNVTLKSSSVGASRVEWYVDDQFASAQTSFVSPIKAPGLQNVRLVAYNAADCPQTLEAVVSVPTNTLPSFEPAEQQSCDGKSLSGCVPFPIDFVNTTFTNGPVSYLWEFGDGATSTLENPSHTYTTNGLFQVTLIVSDEKGCSSSHTKFVIVSKTTPVADFTIDKTSVCAGEEILFTDKSVNADFWCWDFGDGIKSIGKNIKHQYAKPGVYTVKLTAKNAGCSSEKVIVNAILVKDPFVNFLAAKACTDPYTLLLTNVSANYDEMHWEFGDGQTSTTVNVGSHHYQNEGLYTLKLIGKNNTTGCTTIAFAPIVIQEVKADFDINTDKPCRGAPLIFTDKSRAAVEWEWSLDTFSSTAQNPVTSLKTAGNYTAVLKVTDSDGCTATKSKPITVLDMEGNFKFKASSNCDDFTVDFENQSTGTPPPTVWSWNFGDGGTSTDRHPTHVYHELGKYNVSLSVTNALGTCVFMKDNAVLFTNPIPDFEKAKLEYCRGEGVTIANTTKNALTYQWDYGDGRRSDFFSPTIVYENAGTYDITLFAMDAYGCEKKIVKPDFVAVVQPNADFSVASAAGLCPPFTAAFTDKSQKNIKSWKWEFGDGQTSVLQHPANTYQKPGAFGVRLTVTDVNGCVDTKLAPQFVTVGGPTGSFTSSGSNQCTNQVITFNSTVNNTAILRWDFGDGTVVEQQTNNEISHGYTSTGTFTPSLILFDVRGCRTVADGSTVLTIKDTTKISIEVSPFCIRPGEKLSMKGNNEDNNDVLGWTWLIDGNVVGSGGTFATSVSDPGLHIVKTFAVNKFQCVSTTSDTVMIHGPLTTIPNVFTPNGDRANATFNIIGLENSTWDIDIVNRWGRPVYSAKGYNGNWDGEEHPAGVYYYIIRNAVCPERDYRGYVSIVR